MSENLLSLGGLSLDRLRNFCLIADHGSLTKAARGDAARMALFSRQIKELESFFGVELRRRQGKGIVITEAGRRLAALAREQFAGLEDFRRTSRSIPLELTLASGNSVLEWLLLPRMKEIGAGLPDTRFRLLGVRTADVVEGLTEQRIDFGILRADALIAGLRSARLHALGYALFVPRALAGNLRAANLKERLAALPIATSAGGQFRERLEVAAAKVRWPLDIALSCSSFTQAARAVETGGFAAVLPDIAAAQFASGTVSRFDLPFLKSHVRPLVLAWNPRAAAAREIVERAAPVLTRVLTG